MTGHCCIFSFFCIFAPSHSKRKEDKDIVRHDCFIPTVILPLLDWDESKAALLVWFRQPATGLRLRRNNTWVASLCWGRWGRDKRKPLWIKLLSHCYTMSGGIRTGLHTLPSQLIQLKFFMCSSEKYLTLLVSCVSIMKLWTCFSALVNSNFLETTATNKAVQPAPWNKTEG